MVPSLHRPIRIRITTAAPTAVVPLPPQASTVARCSRSHRCRHRRCHRRGHEGVRRCDAHSHMPAHRTAEPRPPTPSPARAPPPPSMLNRPNTPPSHCHPCPSALGGVRGRNRLTGGACGRAFLRDPLHHRCALKRGCPEGDAKMRFFKFRARAIYTYWYVKTFFPCDALATRVLLVCVACPTPKFRPKPGPRVTPPTFRRMRHYTSSTMFSSACIQ